MRQMTPNLHKWYIFCPYYWILLKNDISLFTTSLLDKVPRKNICDHPKVISIPPLSLHQNNFMGI